ncbi:hypothetical protein C9I57_14140 [Trinickia symbiotica]|uniref:Glycoside hydrolase family 5 domain-containing protein n=1 Tax=Trinickia symbiotica TaxID=863227 RepID=A0A2T3XUK6_9BURK|nr:hypothetical protein C9I57_14140 [Trinickia symbiotica]
MFSADFYKISIDQDHLAGIVDFSDLARGPLRDSDRLIACGARLCRAGERGAEPKPVRLFGVTLAFDSVFPSDDQADRLIARFHRLGINLVRLHSFDTVPSSRLTTAESILLDGPFPSFNPESLRRLRRFIAKLAQGGIYVDLNLHVAYTFRPAIDKVPFAFPGDDFMPEDSKPVHLFDERMIGLQKEYARRLLRALAPVSRNAVAIVEISNESSLVYEWSIGRLGDDVKGYYRDELVGKWLAFQSRAGEAANPTRHLPERDGPEPSALKNRFVAFLTELDQSYLDGMRETIKSELPGVLVVGTQMAYGGYQNLISNGNMDLMDSHVYVDHYGFTGKFFDWGTWYIHDVSAFDDGLESFRNVALYRESGKPYIVSEYNQPWPNRQAAEIIPLMATIASLQDWSAIVFYDYSSTRADFDATTPREFVLDTDFTKLPTVGPMAWLYRTFQIAPAAAAVDVALSSGARLTASRDGVTDDSARFIDALRQGATRTGLSLRLGVSLSTDESYSVRANDERPQTVGAQVSFGDGRQRMVLDARSAIGVVGRVAPGVEHAFGSFQLKLSDRARGVVTFIAMARDGEPIERSRRMLWVLPGYTLGSKPGTSPPEPERLAAVSQGIVQRAKDLVKSDGSPRRLRLPSTPRTAGFGALAAYAPVWMERVECTITLRHAFSHVTAYPLDGRGRRLAALPLRDAQLRDGVLTVHLQADGQELTPWYELVFD